MQIEMMMHASEGVSSAAGDDDVAPEAMQSEAVSSAADDDDVAAETATARPPHPLVHASFLSRLLFIWPNRLMGNKSRVRAEDEGTGRASIEEIDLPDVLESDASAANLRRFQDMWDAEQERAARVKDVT